MVRNNPVSISPSQAHDKENMVTIRVVNLPPDIDEANIRRLFGLNEHEYRCVLIERIHANKVVVKVILPQSLGQEMLKFNMKTIHHRVIKVYKTEKCRLGDSCARKVCRFGHEERYRIEMGKMYREVR